MGNKCFGTPAGYSDVNGKRRAPCVAANIMAIYSGSHGCDMEGGVWGCAFVIVVVHLSHA